MGTPAPLAKPNANQAIVGIFLGLVALLAYLPAFRGGFIFDDNVFLTENPLIAASHGLRRFWFSREPADYWPLTSTTLWLEWRVWGLNAAGYHATNISLHVGEVLLFWTILKRLRIPGAIFGAMLFAVHPLNAESVAWITQRKNLMGMLFYLLSIFWFIEPEEVPNVVGSRENSKTKAAAPLVKRAIFGARYGLSLLAFTLAMLSKGSVVILPVVLLGLVLWNRRPTTRDIFRLAPFFAIAVGLAAFESTFSTVGEPVAFQPIQIVLRVLRAGAAIWFYIGKTVWPVNLCFDYGLWDVHPTELKWWLPLVAAVALTFILRRFRKGWGRSAWFAWGYFCIAMFPALGFAEVGFMKYSPVSGHYAHLALLGAGAFSGALWAQTSQPVRSALAAILIGWLSVLAWRQAEIYADGERLYRDTIERNPSSWLAHTNLGVILTLAGNFDQALVELETAVRIKPDFAKAHGDLGVVFYRLNRIDEAMREYREALRIDPDRVEAHNNLGAALARSGRLREAIEEFKQALRIDPDFANARVNLERAEKMQR